MKVILVLAALVAIANAKVNIFIEDKQVYNDKLVSPFPFKVSNDYTKVVPQPMPFALALSQRNAIDDKIIEILEQIREQLDVGFPELGIPPLDPLRLEKISFQLNQPLLFKANVNIVNIIISGIKDFIIEKVKFNVLGLTLDMDLTVPDINYNSGFNADGKILVLYPFDLSGFAKMRMKNFNTKVNAKFSTTITGYLRLRNFEVAFDVEETSFYVSGIVGNGPIADIINWVLSNVSNDLLQNQLESISKMVSEILFDIISEIVKDIHISDIIG